MANLHAGSLDFSPSAGFSCPTWGSQSFQKDWAHLQTNHKHFISDPDFEWYTLAFAKAAAHIATFEMHEHNYGIIHADLHMGNTIFQNNEPYPIDFGRCRFGYHLYDIAQAIMGLHPPQRAFFIEGYSVVRKLEDDAASKLESFLVIAIIEAYSFYAESASDKEMLIEDQPFAQAILKSYLEGEPFLLF